MTSRPSRHLHLLRRLPRMAALLVVAFALALPAAAQDRGGAQDRVVGTGDQTGQQTGKMFRAGRDVAVDAQVSDDLFAAGRAVDVVGARAVDMFLAGSRVSVRDSGAQDIFAAGASVDVGGEAEGDVMAAGGRVELSAAVGGDAMLAGARVRLRDGADIGGDALVAARRLEVGGHVAGMLRAVANSVVLRGVVDGDAEIYAEEIVLAEGAQVRGVLRHGGAAPEIRPGATVGTLERMQGGAMQDIAEGPPHGMMMRFAFWAGAAAVLGFVLGLALVGAGITGFAPGLATATVDTMQDWPWASLGVGVAIAVGVPVFAGLLSATVVGIPLALVLMAAWFVWLAVAVAMGGYWLGMWLRGRLSRTLVPPGGFARFLWVCLGLLVLLLVGLIPFVGWLAFWAIALMALGAMTMEGWSVKSREWGRA